MVTIESDSIAVVDDDIAVLESYRFMLELAGFKVAAYPSAIDYLTSPAPRPRCMILDQHMPVMTGLELVAKLREKAIALPIMLVTSSPSPAIVRRAAELGISRVLEKPPSEEDLLGFVSGAP